MRKFVALKTQISNRGVAPDAFLNELIDWTIQAPDEIFAVNPHADIFVSIENELGPFPPDDLLKRRSALATVLWVLAGFESSWDWTEGRDITNSTSNTACTEEAGIFQCSGNAMNFDHSLKELLAKHASGDTDCDTFRVVSKRDHVFAIEFCARLLRFTVNHHGPVKRKEINVWLKKPAMDEMEHFISEGMASAPGTVGDTTPPTLKRGDKGNRVAALQSFLNTKGASLKVDGDFGALTESALKTYQRGLGLVASGIVDDATAKAIKGDHTGAEDSMPWLAWMRNNIGEKEIPGSRDNTWIEDCFDFTSYGHAEHDEVPWCAASLCRDLSECGYTHTHSAAAASFINYGTPCGLEVGAIAVYRHHVTIVDSITSKTEFVGVGGNQSDQVKRSNFSTTSNGGLVGLRWPVKA